MQSKFKSFDVCCHQNDLKLWWEKHYCQTIEELCAYYYLETLVRQLCATINMPGILQLDKAFEYKVDLSQELFWDHSALEDANR